MMSSAALAASPEPPVPSFVAWRELFCSEPPRSPSLVRQAVAWREQVLAHGDVLPVVEQDLAQAVERARTGRRGDAAAGVAADVRPKPASTVPELSPGTRLVKAHGGRTHVVEVTDGGMLYDGALYASLSAVAKAITGTHWNGLLFFGLRKRKAYPAKARAHG